MKKFFIITALMLSAVVAKAQESPKWINNVKLSGYGIMQYQYSNQKGSENNSFNLRMARVSLDGRVLKDWYWKTQIQFNGNTSNLGSSPRIVDLFVEWQHFDWMRIKMGQFKNPIFFENPLNPIDQGFIGFSQVVQQLANFSGRDGSHSSNGRDIGVQLQGDFLKNAHGRNLIHYQVGLFNGQGINVKDVDQQKNIIGGFWVMPVKGMRLGWFGWTGSYARKGSWTDESGQQQLGTRKLQQRRYAFSAEYIWNDWTFRSEYAHQTGYGFKNRYQDSDDAASNNGDINMANGDKAQGLYAQVIAPIIKNKFHVKARYDMFQPSKGAEKQKTNYDIGLDYCFTKNIQLSGIYSYTHNRALEDKNYSTIDFQISYRF
jgi:hypothetical protein